jgi:hypothetical protein
MKSLFTLLLLSVIITLKAQVGIGITTANSSAQLDITSTNKGLLVPRMTMAQRNLILTPATGLMIFQIDNIQGFYYYNGSTWVSGIGTVGAQGIQGVTGNNGTNGVDGIKGETGAQGFTGATGNNGNNGTNGAQGIHGATGADGIKGNDGAQGVKGDTGADGLNGNNGANGAQGIHGIKGDTGAIGVTGNNGTNGTNGVDGIKGETGAQGTKGDSGLPGVIGIVLPMNGGTGINNNNASTLSLVGANAISITTSGITSLVLPQTGTLYGTATESISSAQILNSLSDESGTGNIIFSNTPTFTGTPIAPTAAIGTNTTQLATTEFVLANSNKHYTFSSGTEISTSLSSYVLTDGMTFSPAAGTYAITFNSQYSITPSNNTGSPVIDLRAAYNLLIVMPDTKPVHAAVYGLGETLTPGVYSTATASALDGNLTLDAQGNSNAMFVFKIGAALSSVAGTNIILLNGALASNIYWVAEGAISIGVSSNIKGTLLSNSGAVTIGNNSILQGSAFTNNGAIVVDGSTITKVVGGSSIFGVLSSFALYTSVGAVSNIGSSIVNGDIGTNVGAITGFDLATLNGTIYNPGSIINSTNNTMASFSIYENGIIVPFTERTRTSLHNTGEISLQAVAHVNAGEAIEIRWKVASGTVKLNNRICTLINVR